MGGSAAGVQGSPRTGPIPVALHGCHEMARGGGLNEQPDPKSSQHGQAEGASRLAPSAAASGGGGRVVAAIKEKLRAALDIYEGMFIAPYRHMLYGEYLKERDLFLLLVFSDMLGAPNPVAFYTLELYPELLEQFHEWHLRLGMPHAPEGGFRCC